MLASHCDASSCDVPASYGLQYLFRIFLKKVDLTELVFTLNCFICVQFTLRSCSCAKSGLVSWVTENVQLCALPYVNIWVVAKKVEKH